MNEESKKENKKGILGAKKIAIIVAAIIGVIVIGGVSIVALTKKDNKPEKTVAEKKEGTKVEQNVKEEVPAELQQWQKDYARVLMDILYAPTYSGRVLEQIDTYLYDDILGPKLWVSNPISDRFAFELLDVNGDEIPELFVYEKVGKEYDAHRLMFTTGETIGEAYVGLVSDVNITEHTIALRGYEGGGTRETRVCEFNGNQAIPKLGFCVDFDYEKYIYTRWSELDYDAVEEITKEEYEQLAAEYHCEKDFSTGLYELTLENVEAQLEANIHLSNKFISLYQYIEEVCQGESGDLLCEEIYFNDDESVDYVLTHKDYFHVLLVSREDGFYKYDDLTYGTHSSYYQYIEKAGILIRRGSDNPGEWFEINEMNDKGELIHTGTFYEEYLLQGYSDPVVNPETGEYYITYKYMGMDDSVQEMTKEEWGGKLNAQGVMIDLDGGIPIEEFSLKIVIDIQAAGGESQSQYKTTLEKATHFTTASASSTLPDEGKYNYSPTNVLTKDASCWVEGAFGYGEGEWIKFELPEKQLLSGLKIINGYAAGTLKQYTHNSKITEVLIEFSNGDSITTTLEVFDDVNKNTVQKIKFDKPVETSYVKITIKGAKAGECQDTCLTYVAPF